MNDTQNDYKFSLTTWEGVEEEHSYKLPPLRNIEEYMKLSGNFPAQVAYLVGEELEWADRFTDDSIYALLDKVGEQMDPRIAAWAKRIAAINQKLNSIRDAAESSHLDSTGTESAPTSSLPRAFTGKPSQISQFLK